MASAYSNKTGVTSSVSGGMADQDWPMVLSPKLDDSGT
jgi:hypothetical protein